MSYSIQHMQAGLVDDLLDQHQRKHSVKTYQQHPLALLLQLKDNSPYDECRVVDEITNSTNIAINPTNFEKSKEILEYYSEKFLFAKLKGQKLSTYRNRLMEMYDRFKKGNFTASADDIRALWRLDNMYAVDSIVEQIVKKYTSAKNTNILQSFPIQLRPAVSYNHLRSRTRRGGDKKVFVFSDNSGVVYTLETASTNNLLPIMDWLFSENLTIDAKISGVPKLLDPDRQDFYVIKLTEFRLH